MEYINGEDGSIGVILSKEERVAVERYISGATSWNDWGKNIEELEDRRYHSSYVSASGLYELANILLRTSAKRHPTNIFEHADILGTK